MARRKVKSLKLKPPDLPSIVRVKLEELGPFEFLPFNDPSAKNIEFRPPVK
jgi:hypothetical protein